MRAGGRGEEPTCIRVITISAGPRWRQENKQRVRARRRGAGGKVGERGKRGREEMLAGGETGKGFRGGDRPGMGSEPQDSYPERLGGGGNQGRRVTCAPRISPTS